MLMVVLVIHTSSPRFVQGNCHEHGGRQERSEVKILQQQEAREREANPGQKHS
jgi:hypothetical protein